MVSGVRREKLYFTLAAGTILLLVLARHVQFRDWHLEDSYIIYRIAGNIISGNGWSYNPGEVKNASTSVLNTVLVALVSLSGTAVPDAAHAVGSLSIFMCGLLALILFRRQTGMCFSLGAALLMVYFLSGNATWGLETHLFCALLLLFVYFEMQGKDSWMLLGLLVLTRPDALLLAAFKWLKEVWFRRQLSAGGLLRFLLVLSPWIAFSVWHFGQIFPDTLSSKMWQGNSGYWGAGWIYLQGLRQHVLQGGWLWKLMYLGGAAGALSMLPVR